MRVYCPMCGRELLWDDQDREWICRCGAVYTEEEVQAMYKEHDDDPQ